MNQNTAFQRLDSAQYLHLRELSEPHDHSLKLIVEEAVVNRSGVTTALPELDIVLKDTAPIESVEGCATFELYWKHYAAYLVTEELVGSNAKNGYDDESYTGKLLRVYSTSHFLDHIARDTGGHSEPLQHYKPGLPEPSDRRGCLRVSRCWHSRTSDWRAFRSTVAGVISPLHSL